MKAQLTNIQYSSCKCHGVVDYDSNKYDKPSKKYMNIAADI